MKYNETKIILREGTILTQSSNGTVIIKYTDGTTELLLPCGLVLDENTARRFLSAKVDKVD